MKKLLITGAAGFLGRTFSRYFSRKGWQVFGIDKISEAEAPLADLKTYVNLELPHPNFLEILRVWKPDACIHAAGRASVPLSMQDPASDFSEGPALTFYVLDMIRQYCPQCSFVYLSSAAVYGNPLSLPVQENQLLQPISAYGYHKWQSEILCEEFSRLFGVKTASARLFSAYGPWLRRQVLWDICYKAAVEKEVVLQGTGIESRDFIHSLDIALALETIINSAPLQGEAYNVASGQETNIFHLSQMIIRSLGIPIIPKFSGSLPEGTPLNWCADISKISALGFSPEIALEDGIKHYVAWFENTIRERGDSG